MINQLHPSFVKIWCICGQLYDRTSVMHNRFTCASCIPAGCCHLLARACFPLLSGKGEADGARNARCALDASGMFSASMCHDFV